MHRWMVVGLVVGDGLGASACSSGSGASPEASCRPGLVQAGTTYRIVEAPPSGLAAGEAVPDASLLGCQDAGQARAGGGPVDAWRATGLGSDSLVTLTECARLEGTSAAADCDPAASRYTVWRAEVTSSS
jgi:hypothetical protein